MDAEKKATSMKRRHFDLKDIERYMRNKEYPSEIKDWGQKSKFRRACRNVSIANRELIYKNKRVVILEKKRQMEIIRGLARVKHQKPWLHIMAEVALTTM